MAREQTVVSTDNNLLQRSSRNKYCTVVAYRRCTRPVSGRRELLDSATGLFVSSLRGDKHIADLLRKEFAHHLCPRSGQMNAIGRDQQICVPVVRG